MAELTALIVLAILCQSSSLAGAQNFTVRTVSPDCSPDQSCWDIDSALYEITSGTTLHLQPGNHLMTQSHFRNTRGISNVSIIGYGIQNTVINCTNQTGLAFIGMENISFVNFTITNCGLTGANLNLSVTLLEEVVDLWFLVPDVVRVALFIGDCRDVVIEDVFITNTTGLGLLGINVLGNSELTRVNFTRNIRPQCIVMEPVLPSLITPDIFNQVGGGAYFLYSDYRNASEVVNNVSLALEQCYFAYNGDCTYASNVNIDFRYYTSNSQGLYEYAIGAGGGLSVVLANSYFGVSVSVADTVFRRNDARYGGGAYVSSFAGFQQRMTVSFSNCTFLENGVSGSDSEGIIEVSYCKGGAGLAIFTDLLRPKHFVTSVSTPENAIVVMVTGSKFVRNKAEVQGGGVMAYSLFNTPHASYDLDGGDYFFIIWIFTETTFVRNSARYGSAGYFHQMVTFGYFGTAALYITSLNVSNSYHILDDQDAFQHTAEEPSAIHLREMACAFEGTNTLSDNVGSALHVDSSVITLLPQASIIFQGNLANYGGGVRFQGISSGFVHYPNSHLKFINNHAIIEGGAIYFDSLPIPGDILRPLNLLECFISTPSFSRTTNPSGHFDLLDNGITFSFQNNSAPLGSIVFGSTLETCPWAWNITRNDSLSLYQTLHRDYNSTFIFDTEPTGQDMVSTLPAQLSVSLLSKSENTTIQIVPGQVVDVGIEVLDFYGRAIPAVVTSVISDRAIPAISILGSSGFWLTSVYPSPLRISGMYIGVLNVSIITATNSLRSSFSLELLPCPIGFSINSKTQTCLCNELLLNVSDLSCFNDSVAFKTGERVWVGVNPSIENATTGDLIVHRCLMNYCNMREANVTPSAFDSQCVENRVGLLCGGCAEGYSNVFGTNDCLKCSNYWLFLIPVFALAGAVLFTGITLLEITVDKGLTNVIILFVSIVSVFDHRSFNPRYAYFFIPGRLLGLQIGASTCFFDGMTPAYRSLLNLVFPIYLYLLIIIFTMLCRRYSWMSVHFSPAKTMLTVTSLCYFSILTTCLEIMIGVTVKTVDGRIFLRWLENPNQPYFAGLHGFLVSLAILITIFYLIPLPFIALLPSLSYKYLHKISIFLDIQWASYKPKLRFWLGVRMALVAFVFIFSRVPPPSGFIINGNMVLIFSNIQLLIQPYKDKWANYADMIFLLIVIFFYWGAQTSIDVEQGTLLGILGDIFVSVITIAAYSLMVALFILHMHRQFPTLGPSLCSKIKIRGVISKLKKRENSNARESPHTTVVVVDDEDDINYQASEDNGQAQDDASVSVSTCRPPSPTHIPRFMVAVPRYRESLLGSDDSS